jgi:small subunit ribosomal protein S6
MQVGTLTDQYQSLIEEKGGKVRKREYCGFRTLAYPIRNNRKAHYMLLAVEVPAVVIPEIERQMRLSEDVLRFLVVRVETIDESPCVLSQGWVSHTERFSSQPSSSSRNVVQEEKTASSEAVVQEDAG